MEYPEPVVSMDGLSLMCPPEIRKGGFDPWPHVDQQIPKQLEFLRESSLKTIPYNIQGQFLFEDSFDGDEGFIVFQNRILCSMNLLQIKERTKCGELDI